MKKMSNPQKCILYAIPILFIFGSLLHFTFDLSGKMPWVGIFSAVNESVWEHMKLAVFPILIWWGLYYLVNKTNYGIDGNRWAAGCLTSLLVSIFTVPLLFYFYTNAFGIENMWVDIVIFLIAVALGQLMGLHIYSRTKGINMYVIMVIIAFTLALFIIFTYSAPNLPIFMDSTTGTYGIMKN